MNYFDEDQFAVPEFCHSEESLRIRQQLLDFIEIEVEAEEREVRRKHKQAVSKRVQNGSCITGLKFQGIDKDGSYTYSYSSNQSNFRDGEILVINEVERRGHDVLNEGVLVWLKQIDYHKKLLKLDQAMDMELPQTDKCILDKGICDYNSGLLKQSVCMSYALDMVPELIEGRASLSLQEEEIEREIRFLQAECSTLTQLQCAAVASAKYRRLTLIQGPPGTGKSFVLAKIIERALRANQSVLVTGPSHNVIDSLLRAVAQKNCSAEVIKITNQHCRLGYGISEVKLDDPRVNELSAPFLVGATVFKDYKLLRNDQINFDLVVIDEAGQMPVVHGLPALLHADRFVIAGDHKQLAPIIQAPERHPNYLKRSLFELLHEHYPTSTHMLDVTFRMNAQINKFPNRVFYDGKLKPSFTAGTRKFRFSDTARGDLYDIIARNESVTFIELEHAGMKAKSDGEADLVARLAKELIQHHDLSLKELAIIAPLKAHNENIRKKFGALIRKDPSMKGLRYWELIIDTVHRMQGQEREAVILSLCASDRDYLVNCDKLLFDPHLLNVAITRSKTRLFVIGSRNFFPHIARLIIDTGRLEVWQRFYEYLVNDNHRVIYRAPTQCKNIDGLDDKEEQASAGCIEFVQIIGPDAFFDASPRSGLPLVVNHHVNSTL